MRRDILVESLSDLTKENQLAEQKGWGIYDSGLVSGPNPLEFDFMKLYPKEFGNIRLFLEDKYRRKKGKIVGLEIGGPGSRLFGDFSPGFFLRSIGVTLSDSRTIDTKKTDQSRNHTVLVCDIFSPSADSEINKQLNGKRADIIFERMENGLLGFPENFNMFKNLLLSWYSFLNDGGIMFIQSPPLLDENNFRIYKEWLEEIQGKSSREVLDFSFDAGRFYIRIKKENNKTIN